jgi:serine/threonine protein kinase
MNEFAAINVMRHGRKIVLIDLDSSRNFSEYLGNDITLSKLQCVMLQLGYTVLLSLFCFDGLGYMPPEMVHVWKESLQESSNNLTKENIVALFDRSLSIASPHVKRSGSEAISKWRAKLKEFPVDEKGAPVDDGTAPYRRVRASPSYDIWCLGVLMYFMCMKENLWLENMEGDIRETDLVRLGLWTTQFKAKVLSRISNPNARNLIGQMLSKDPAKRPSATRIMSHPFISGKAVARMVGEDPLYDVFISYRVKSEKDFAAAIYQELTKRGLKCYLDRFCLKQGVSWEQGFCDGLAQSLTFVPLLSRNGINNPDVPRQNFTRLKEESAIDNVFLEHRLAQELEIFGLIEKILPVQIPDMQEDGTYSNYHASKCGPVMGPTNDIVVHSVEEKLLEHLDRLGLGTPLNENLTVKQVWERLMKHQAITLTGDFQSAITKLADSIVNMVADTKDAQLRARIAGGAVNVNSQDDSDTDALEIDVDGLGGLSGIGSGMRFDSDMTLNSSLNSKEGFSSLDAADDGSFLVSPNLRHSVKGTLMLSREKRIQELEEEVKLLKAENEQLKQQIQTLKKN